MYKRILVALDGSVSARLALEEALKLAQTSDAMLMVAHVVSHDVCVLVGGRGESVGDVCERSAVRCMTRIIDAHGASIPGALMQAAQAFEADLIVMGTHGLRAARRHLIGSVAETVLRSAHVPVLTVRDDQHDTVLARERRSPLAPEP